MQQISKATGQIDKIQPRNKTVEENEEEFDFNSSPKEAIEEEKVEESPEPSKQEQLKEDLLEATPQPVNKEQMKKRNPWMKNQNDQQDT